MALHAGGLSLAQLAARLGCTRQGAHYLLRAAGVEIARTVLVPCPRCGAVAGRIPARRGPPASALCRACLARSPGAPFGARLRACRVAAGISLKELARRSGLSATGLIGYDAGRVLPSGRCLAALLALLGPALVPGCERLPPVPPPPLAERLRACRRAAGLRQLDVAARSGIDPVKLCSYERGRCLPGWRVLCRLVAVLGPGLLAGS